MGSPNNKGAVAPLTKPPAVSEDTVRMFIEMQSRETALRLEELKVRAAEVQNHSAHAEKMLATQERDLADERSNLRKMRRDRLIFGAVLALFVVLLIGLGMYLNKDQLVGDLTKVLVGVVAGAVGGYGFGTMQRRRDRDRDEDAHEA